MEDIVLTRKRKNLLKKRNMTIHQYMIMMKSTGKKKPIMLSVARITTSGERMEVILMT